MTQSLDEMIADPINKIRLDDKEKAALDYWKVSGQPELAPAKRMELMGLYLRGYSTEQIRKEHQVFSLGQIVHAKVKDKWDLAVEEYVKRLRDSMIDQIALTTAETARTLVDVLAAVNHHLGVKARKYLETHNPADLPFSVDKVREYQALISSYQMVAGGPPKKVEHEHTVTAVTPGAPERIEATAEDDDEDSRVLALLAGETNEPKSFADKVKKS